MASALLSILNYETIKLVTITNWKLGLIHRSIQVLVLFYIVVYAIWYSKGYQKISPINGVLYTKVKGIATDDNGSVYDSGDLVFPPTEPLALFIATRSLRTLQHEDSLCYDPEKGNACKQDSDCRAGSFTSNGVVQPSCDTTANRCIVRGWCPVENDAPQFFTAYTGLLNWTVYLRSHISYSEFKVSTDNADIARIGYNIFPLTTILEGQNWTEVNNKGAIINVKIDWSCDLDSGLQNCKPTYQYVRTGDAGFNYRQTTYIANTSAPDYFPSRVYTKYVGIRFVFEIIGTGRKFDIAATVVTLGSGAAFFSIATLVTDYIILYFHPKKQGFDQLKRQYTDLGGEDPSSDTSYVKA